MSLVWARMPGFPPWPARLSTVHEQAALELSKASKKTTKSAQIAVVFLGSDYQSGWVNQSSIQPFNLSTFKLHCVKTFKRTNAYQAALVEAIRVYNTQQHLQGRIDQLVTNELCRSLLPLDKPLDESLSTNNDNCSFCGGTSHSGPYLDCAECANSFLHFHCIDPPICRRPKKEWNCRTCCDKFGKDYDVQLTVDKTVYMRVNEKERTAIGGRSSRARRAGRSADGAAAVNVVAPTKGDCDVITVLGHSPSNFLDSSTSVKRKNSTASTSQSNGYSTSSDCTGNQKCTDKEGANRMHSMDTPSAAFTPLSTTANNVPECTQGVEDERCFVCGEGGVLMLCDFPVCPRVYHKVCVLRVSEQSVEENDGGDMTYASKGLGCEQTSTEEWFCPLHNCVSCGALEQSPFTLRHLHLPSSLLAILPVDMNGLVRKKLRSCISCPTSLCASCESDIGLGTSFFKFKKLGNFGKVAVKCLNCAVPDPRVRLAKVLEGAWVRMCRSRLATPFIFHLLPGVSAGSAADSTTLSVSKQTELQQHSLHGINGFSNNVSIAVDSEHQQLVHPESRLTWSDDFVELFGSVPSVTTRMFQLGFCSNEHNYTTHSQSHACSGTPYYSISSSASKSVNSFLDILEKIHNLEYFSIHDILTDFIVLRRKLQCILWHFSVKNNDFDVSYDASSVPPSAFHHLEIPRDNVNTLSKLDVNSLSFPDILNAFDTIIAVGLTYLTESIQEIAFIENLIRLSLSQSTHSASNSSAYTAISNSVTSSVSGTSNCAQDPQPLDDEMQTHSQVDTTPILFSSTNATETVYRDANGINFDCVVEHGDEKNNIRNRKTTSEPTIMREGHQVSTLSSQVGDSDVPFDEIAIDSVETDTVIRSKRLSRRRSQNEDYRDCVVAENFSALWRVSCSIRFIGNASHLSENRTIFVGDRTIGGWERFVQEGTVGEVCSMRRVNRMVSSKHENLVHEKVSVWLNHADAQDMMRDKDVAYAMLSITEQNSSRDSNMQNETISLLENVYGEPTLPWSKANEACSKLVDKLASDGDFDCFQPKKSRSFGNDVRSSGSHTTATAICNKKVKAQPSTLSSPLSSSNSAHIQNGVRRTDPSYDTTVDGSYLLCSGEAEIDELPGLIGDSNLVLEKSCGFTDRPDSLYEDETLIALDRMRELTERTMHLQARIHKQYLNRRDESLAVASSGILNIGNGQVVMELKFANDNLRWRLQQKQASLNSCHETIERLQAAIGELECEIDTIRRDAKAAAKELTNTIKRLEAENRALKSS